MGRRGNGLWNSCHRPLVSAETLLLTTTRWQHLKFLNLPKILVFFLSNCLNWKTDGIMSNPTEKFVDAEDRVSLAQQKSAARCQQNGFIVGNTNALAANCIFAKMEKYLSNIDKIFSHHPKLVFFAKFLFFSPLVCFLFWEAQTARPWELGSDCRGFEFLSFPVRGLMFGIYSGNTSQFDICKGSLSCVLWNYEM